MKMYYIFHRAAKKPSISASVSVSVCPRWEAGRVSRPLMGSGPREPVLGSSANQQVLRTEALVYERLGKHFGGGDSLSGSIAERHGGRGENLPAAVFRGGGGGGHHSSSSIITE